ncbi:MAG: hypothetical protein ABSC60_06770 [Acidobacteriota bacterium]
MMRAIVLLALFNCTVPVRAETVASAACTRASLQATVDKYLDALRKGNPSLMPLTPQARYMENRNEIPLGKGIWQAPLAVDFNRSQLDVETCQTFTEIIHTNSDHPYVIGTRLKIEDNKIAEIESLVADKNDWLFNASDYLKYSSQENWDILPAEKRSDRQTLLNAANAYFDTFGDYSSLSKVPWGTPCARIEGGMYTNRNNDPNASCTVGMPKDSSVKIINRHFLVDVDMGTVVGMVDFREEKRNPDVHTFRLENGKLRYVHSIQVCTIQPNCGLPQMKPKPQ